MRRGSVQRGFGPRWVLACALSMVAWMIVAVPAGARGGGDAPMPVPPACTEPSESVALDSVADAETLLVGTWIRCEGTARMYWAHEGDDLGFEFTDDGSFFRIYQSGDGDLIRAEGWLQEGRWVIDDDYDGSTAWLGMKLLGSGYSGLGVTFHDDPVAMRATDGMAGTTAQYIRWTGTAPTPGSPAGVGDGPCGQPTSPVVLESSTQAKQLLTGTWTLCAGEPFGPGVIGAEFAADGSFRAFVHAADGQVTPDAESVGATWLLYPFDEPFDIHNGPQVDIQYADGRTRIFSPEFLEDPPFIAAYGGVGMVAGTPAPLPPTTVPVPPTTVPAPELPSTGPATGAGTVGGLAVFAASLVLIGSAAVWVAVRRGSHRGMAASRDS